MSHKDLAIRHIKEILEEGNLHIIDEIFHPDYSSETYYGDPRDFGPGIEKLKKRISLWKYAFSEKFLITLIMENDDAVYCEYIATIKQKNPWFDRVPKDKTAKIIGSMIFKIKQNKIYELKYNFSFHDLWSQLGYLVDAGEYQLPAHLLVDDNEKIILNQSKLAKYETDYSILQSSAVQFKDLLQYASYMKGYLEISDKAIRAIIFSSVVEWQNEFKMHQSDLTADSLPQELMINTIWMLERGKQKLKDLLMFEEDSEKIERLLNTLIDFFAIEFSK